MFRWLRCPGNCWILLAAVLLAASSLRAQTPDDTTFTRQRMFRIPFQTENGARRLKEVQLYVSIDQGATWRFHASAKPDKGFFTFSAPNDGLYWFTVRTIDVDNRVFPLSIDNSPPGLKVIVDTRAPDIQIRSLGRNADAAEIEWDVRDANLDESSIRVDYRSQRGGQWLPLSIPPQAFGRHRWRPQFAGPIEVRLSAADRAGNLDEATIVVADQAEVTTAQPRPRTDGPANVRLVNSKRIKLDYKVEEVGRSGISVVELWLTRDGRNWQKFSEDRSAKSPYVIDVPGEGLYGFTLVVQSGVGLSDSPPQVGDKPQVWVEVDLTKPDVRLKGIEVGRGYDAGNLTINWSASDKNLAERPIRLTYAEKPDDNNWKLIAENLENTGRYVWRMPVDVPYRFYVRVEAADRAGNIGVAETTQSIIVDLAKPKGIIVDVAPGQ